MVWLARVRSPGHLSKVEREDTLGLDRYREVSMWVVAVNSGEAESRDEAYWRNIPTEAGWGRKIPRFFGGYSLISLSSRYQQMSNYGYRVVPRLEVARTWNLLNFPVG